MGAALAPRLSWAMLAGTVLAFFLKFCSYFPYASDHRNLPSLDH